MITYALIERRVKVGRQERKGVSIIGFIKYNYHADDSQQGWQEVAFPYAHRLKQAG